MSETEPISPDSWKVEGNIAPKAISAPISGDVFDKHNCTLTVEAAVVVDGNLLIPVKSTTAW